MIINFPSIGIRPLLKPKMVPADYGLILVVDDLIYQCGHVAAYNKLISAAEKLKAHIDKERMDKSGGKP